MMYLGVQMTIFVWVVRSRDLFSVHEGPTYVCITPDDYNLLTFVERLHSGDDLIRVYREGSGVMFFN